MGWVRVSFRIILCLTRGFLLNCTFVPCLIPVRIGGRRQEDLCACLLKALVKWSDAVESGEPNVSKNAENKHVLVTSTCPEMGQDRRGEAGRTQGSSLGQCI